MSVQPHIHAVLGLGDPAKQRMHSKLQILRLLDQYRIASGYTQRVAAVMFADAWNNGALAVDESLSSDHPQLSPATLEKWRLKLKRNGIASLAGEYGKKKGQNCIDAQPDVRDHILAMLVKFPHVRATRVYEFLLARFRGHDDKVMPSERTVERWIADWKQKNSEVYTAVTNPDEWKNKNMSAFGSASEGVERLNQRWEVDCTPADLQLMDGRYVLSGGIDVFSRRPKLLVTKSARSAANAQLLRKMMLDFGMPEEIKSDQGKDYVSSEYTTVLAALDVKHALSNKFSPWEKPHIERFFRTFSHDLVELLPGYSGHNVADAQALRASKSFAERLFDKNSVVEIKKTAAELQQFCDDWVESRYAHKPHSGLNDKTPFQVASEWREPVRRIEDVRALDMLLAEVPQNKGLRMVQKKGVRLPEGWYIAPELEAYIGTNQQVHVRYLDDAGKVVVYDTDGFKFICIAELPELTGISRQEIAAKTDAMKHERVQARRAELRAIERNVNAHDAAAEILRYNMISSGKLVAFPKRAEQHNTPALDSAAQAYAELHAPTRNSSELIDHTTFTRLRAEHEAAQAVVTPMFESKAARAFWVADQAFRRELSAEEREFLNDYRRDCPRAAREMDELMALRHGDDAAEM